MTMTLIQILMLSAYVCTAHGRIGHEDNIGDDMQPPVPPEVIGMGMALDELEISLENLSDGDKKAVTKQLNHLKVFMEKHHEKMADLMNSDDMQERLEYLTAANERLAVEDDPKNRELVHKEVLEVILELEKKKFEVDITKGMANNEQIVFEK